MSVLVPYFNMGPYVLETIESVLCSNYSPIEIVVVNDASTDLVSRELFRSMMQSEHLRECRFIDLQGNLGLAGAETLEWQL